MLPETQAFAGIAKEESIKPRNSNNSRGSFFIVESFLNYELILLLESIKKYSI